MSAADYSTLDHILLFDFIVVYALERAKMFLTRPHETITITAIDQLLKT